MPRVNENQKIFIDADKLKRELVKRELTLCEASRSIGHNSTYLGHKIVSGYISVADSLLLESQLNISLSSYKREESVEDVKKSDEEFSPVINESIIDYDRLSEVIYKAVYAAAYEGVK